MRICRFTIGRGQPRVGVSADADHLLDLTAAGLTSLTSVLEHESPAAFANTFGGRSAPRVPLSEVTFLPPVDHQEVWAAGVTYLRSKAARMEESDFSATAYDRVYDAERPEIFFKAIADKVVTIDEPVGIRRDARWNVPEPELALVLNSRGAIAGLTLGNDMSSRDIEGENLLYLPQAKVYDRSCALAPWIVLGATEDAAREWTIRITISRGGHAAFYGETPISNIRRRFDHLADYLFRCQRFPHGAVLLTGTGIVPPESFTLAERDVIEIEIPAVGVLRNPVVTV